MDWATLALLLSGIAIAGAQETNTAMIPLLRAGNQSYTNAEIYSVTPAYVDIGYDGGIARIALSNMPDLYRQKYHYSPEKAEQYLTSESNKLKAIRAAELVRRAAYEKAVADLATNTQTIYVDSIVDEQFGYPKCNVSSGNGGGDENNVPGQILIINLPAVVKSFAQDKQKLSADIENLRNQKVVASYTVNDPNDPDPGLTAQIMAQNALQNAKEAKAERLRGMEKKLEDMESQASERTRIKAYFTGHSYAGFQMWKCVSQ